MIGKRDRVFRVIAQMLTMVLGGRECNLDRVKLVAVAID
jgi:hypothetical protein